MSVIWIDPLKLAAIASGFGITYVSGTSTTNNTSDPQTFAGMAIGDAASDRIIIAWLHIASGTSMGAAPTSVTIGGVSATRRVDISGDGYTRLCCYTATIPTGTTANVVIDYSSRGSTNMTAVHLYRMVGQASETPHDTATSGGSTNTHSTTIDIPAGGYLIEAVSTSRGPTYYNGGSSGNAYYASAQTGLTIGVTYTTGAATFTISGAGDDNRSSADGISAIYRSAYGAISYGP